MRFDLIARLSYPPTFGFQCQNAFCCSNIFHLIYVTKNIISEVAEWLYEVIELLDKLLKICLMFQRLILLLLFHVFNEYNEIETEPSFQPFRTVLSRVIYKIPAIDRLSKNC